MEGANIWGRHMLDVCALIINLSNVLGAGALLFAGLLGLIVGVSASFSSTMILHEESLSLQLMRLFACLMLFRSAILTWPKIKINKWR
jgi:hypothetical protein